ncbi:glycosyltransferase involved in cell wall biosynthesis [Ancylobacter aquaticus]|uniref:Glycosyltransferase involved in cell wall biosynthesis n=1 Tax=Ancylobacter aquaticus TaxID=100 RepID=A0A4R1I9R1_ANCAQ|nr:glycosyltransferase family 1 protein [Ancylobacter aquaticus]TCK30665.1 glycosyltransferase involved in cell wall biosynthesis [Ancylobacter aquaticus]
MARKAPLFINGKFMSGGATAVHRVAQELITALAEAAPDREMRLLVPPGLERLNNDPGIPARPVGRFGGIAWEQISLPLHVRGGFVLNLCNRAPLALRNGLTLMHDAQAFTAPHSYPLGRRVAGQWQSRAAGRRQLGLLTVSEFARSELVGLRLAPAGRVHVIPNGVDHVLRTPAQDDILPRLGLVPRGYALALANLMPHKNIPLLIRAFARPALAGMTLVLVGGTGRDAFAAAGVTAGANVVFPGYVSDGEMRALQTHALAVCTPSLTEGFGMPPVEGLKLGTPAVIAPRGALPEVCGPGALQADPHDPAAWEAALLRLRDDQGLHDSLARDGQAFVARFTWQEAARRLLDVIDAVAPG